MDHKFVRIHKNVAFDFTKFDLNPIARNRIEIGLAESNLFGNVPTKMNCRLAGDYYGLLI